MQLGASYGRDGVVVAAVCGTSAVSIAAIALSNRLFCTRVSSRRVVSCVTRRGLRRNAASLVIMVAGRLLNLTTDRLLGTCTLSRCRRCTTVIVVLLALM